MSKNVKQLPKRRLRLGRILIALLILLFFIALVLGGIGFGMYKYATSQAGDLNVVIMGVDGRELTDNTSRADTIMLLHIEKETNTISTISIPRDAYVKVSCEGENGAYDKITHAYAYGEVNWTDKGGGSQCVIDTVREVFQLKELTKYVEVDFFKMISLVDILEGIDLTPTATFCEMDENESVDTYCFEEGVEQHMDGATALAYARHRMSDSDIYRAGRQQEVIKAMFKKAKSLSLPKLYSFAKKALDEVDTNLTFWELFGYLDLLEGELILEQEVIPGEDDYKYSEYYGDYVYYYAIDQMWLQKIIQKVK